MKKKLLLILVISISFVGCDNEHAKPNPDKIGMLDVDKTIDLDNSDRDIRDYYYDRKTLENQNETESDRMITQAIRQSIFSDDNLSANAKNIIISTSNGKVTLRGVVDNSQEKSTIELKVKSIHDVKQIYNWLEVVPYPY